MNHVLLLDSASTALVKVQGMYFLSSTLPSFMLGGELFLVRQVSKGSYTIAPATAVSLALL